MAASPTDYTVDHGENRGQIEYSSDQAHVLIGYTRVEHADGGVNFWKGDYYQGTVDTETNRLFYGNDEVDFRVDVPQEFVDEIQSEVVDE